MKIGHIVLAVLGGGLAVAAYFKWDLIKSWFIKDATKTDKTESIGDEDDSVDCNDPSVNRWVYVFEIEKVKNRATAVGMPLGDSKATQVVKDIYSRGSAYFGNNMKWIGEKDGKVSFELTSKGAKSIIDTAIKAVKIPYNLKCFVSE